jgi:hypothetical protein
MLKFISRTFALVAISLFILAVSPTISNKSDKTSAVATPQTFATQKPVAVDAIVLSVVAAKDNRAEKLAAYFAANSSPFAPYAENFITVADKYDLDWTLLPAIANLESQLGKQVPGNSFNPYGWNNGKFNFGSWENANEIVANGLRTRYAPTGEVTPFRIGNMYAESPTWAVRVAKYQLIISNW